jgi:glucose/arabinose dehydrogenase
MDKNDMKWFIRLFPLVILLLALAVLPAFNPPPASAAGSALDFPVYLPSVFRGLPLPPADEAANRISVPPGFAIRIFADGIRGQPRFMAFGPDGALYVSAFSAGQIMRLPDGNRDGLADANQVVASGLNLPHGLEWRSGWLYVAETDRVERLRDSNGDGSLDQKELVTDNISGQGGHASRSLHFGPDGKLYVSVGSSCNVCVETDPRRAAILRFNPDGSIPADNPFATDPDVRRRPLWAWGLRNSVDFLWTPGGQMWADHNGRDNLLDANGLPDNLPPEEVVIPVTGGKSHGWPYCYTAALGANPTLQPEILDPQSGLSLPAGFTCNKAVPALFTLPAHSAPLGMTWPQAGNFPAAYRADLLYVAVHGSWNVNDPANIRDCKVEIVRLNNGLPASSEVFANGWRASGQACGGPDTWGRPADVVFGPAGDLYISDDRGGRILRVVYTH